MTTMRIRSLFELAGSGALIVLAMALSLAPVHGARAEPTDADFAMARDAFHAGDAAKLDKIAPRLKGHLLESYVEYWQLRLKLDDDDPDRVRSFLARREGSPLADRLRGVSGSCGRDRDRHRPASAEAASIPRTIRADDP